MNSALDLYANIESLIGFDEAYMELHNHYKELILALNVKTLLDVGTGSGGLLLLLKNEALEAKGIDLSPEMVKICREKNLDVECKELAEVQEKFDIIVAAADVLNYLDKHALQRFLSDVEKRLNPQGWFLCDINTYHGFADVTQGTMVRDMDEKFLAIDAEFDDQVLITDITLFEKENGCFQKTQGRILQYFYEVDEIVGMSDLQIVKQEELCLFSEEPDKSLLHFQKV